MKRIKKGEAGYIAYKKRIEFLKTILYFGISLSIFLMGYFTTGSRMNLLTVVAVLGCLPASKSAVIAFMYLKVKETPQEIIDHIKEKTGSLSGYYDLYFTSYSKNYNISHLVITDNSVIGFSMDTKFDESGFQSHLKDMMFKENINDVLIKIFTDKDKYLNRLSDLNAKETKTRDDVKDLIFSISL